MPQLAVCEKCGKSYGVGQWYQCPHDATNAKALAEEWPGGKTFENLADAPVTFYSAHEYRRYLREHNIEEMVRHIEGSPHTRSWATMDPYTLEAAAALVARVCE